MSHNSTKWIGKSLPRKEDVLLLTGKGSFADDLKFSQLYHAAILRSPHAHAKIVHINTKEALKLLDVVGVLTGKEVAQMSKPFPVDIPAKMKYFSAAVGKVRENYFLYLYFNINYFIENNIKGLF